MADENSDEKDSERVMVGARVPKEKKKRIQEQLDYGDTLQDWVEDAIDRKLTEAEEGKSKTEVGPPTAN
jgi:hypothetical protein